MRIIHKSNEPLPHDGHVWQMKTKCGERFPHYMCKYQWAKVNCPKCLKKQDIKKRSNKNA
jgi:hypothetical protein